MSQKDFLNVGLETTKGSALHSLKDEGAAGAHDFSVLNFTGVLIDKEAFTLGDDRYEFNLVATDNTRDTGTGGEYNNTAPGPIQVPLTKAQNFVAGDVILIGSEFMKVVDVGVSSSTVVRGYAGSTIAAHGNSVTIFEAAQQVVAGSFPVPIAALTQATVKVETAAALNYFSVGANERLGRGTAVVDKAALTVEAFVGGGTDAVVIHIPANGGVPVASDGLDSVTVNFTDGGAAEDFMQATDGTDFVDLGITDGETITIGAAVANNGAYVVTGVKPRLVDAFGVETQKSQINVATASWTAATQADAITVSQADAITNGTLTAFSGGVEPASQKYSVLWHVATSAANVSFVAPFNVTEAVVSVFAADGAILKVDGGTNEENFSGSVVVTANRLVTITQAGAVQYSTNDVLKVEFFG